MVSYGCLKVPHTCKTHGYIHNLLNADLLKKTLVTRIGKNLVDHGILGHFWSKKIISSQVLFHQPSSHLGQGAFGVVFEGNNDKKNTIVAKRIDGNLHPRILTQDKFLQLDHPNVMKILDVVKKNNIVWMMIQFCELGDLNNFYRMRQVSHEMNIEVMQQIMMGIEYLHSQDIIHRDIKPGNILVGSESPLRLQLAAFDVSRCLDPEVETSLMTSNVGTLTFKAPEFFQKTSPGKIEYHNNVNIYAAGLTFLAILQAEKGKQLIPQIGTHMDNSELNATSIGQLVFQRIKYQVPELNIVQVEGTYQFIET